MQVKGSVYDLIQDKARPKMKDLAKNNEKIVVLYGMYIQVGRERPEVLRWCQGNVSSS